MWFDFTIAHVPGKDLTIADALSRAPSREPNKEDQLFQQETRAFIDIIIQSLPATEQRLAEIKQCQEDDLVCKQIAEYCQTGWPDKKSVVDAVKPYYTISPEISLHEGLLMRGNRIIIPTSLQKSVLTQLHTGHQGIRKCRERARQSVWWPGLSRQLENLVTNCLTCHQSQIQRAEPMIPSEFPELPWQKVGMDLFEWKKISYLLIVDYYSRYIEIAKLTNVTAEEVIRHTKSIFTRHGIPEVVFSDNSPQFGADVFTNFAQHYQFKHITSSPYYPRSNGCAEHAVGTVKNLLKKEDDPYLALLAYRVTPLSNGYSPSELLMNRRLRSTVPTTRESQKPVIPDKQLLIGKEEEAKQKQKEDYDRRRELPTLLPGDTCSVDV